MMITYRWNTRRKGVGSIYCPNLLNWAMGSGLDCRSSYLLILGLRGGHGAHG